MFLSFPDDEHRGFYELYSINRGTSTTNKAKAKSSRVIGLNSAWGNRGEICKNYGWTLDYLQWQISWVNVQMILADAARCLDEDEVEEQNVTTNELKSKDDIKNFIKNFM